MSKQLLKELSLKIEKLDDKLERLIAKGCNDEKLVTKKRELQKQMQELTIKK